MSVTDAAKNKMQQIQEAAACVDRKGDYVDTRIRQFRINAIASNGKVYELNFRPHDAAFHALLADFTLLLKRELEAAQAVLTGAGIE